MRKEYIQRIVTRHWNKIKVFWWIIAIVVMLFAIKTYVNYSMITEEIEKVNYEIESTKQEIAYSQNFYSKYLDSDYAMYFLSHKNNVLFDNEYIIRISNTSIDTNNTSTTTGNIEKYETPQESRKRFIKWKLN